MYGGNGGEIVPEGGCVGMDPKAGTGGTVQGGKAGESGPEAEAGGTVPEAGSNGIDLYLLAGVKTWPSYFREPAVRLKRMLIEAGYANAETHVLYPYGDYTIPLLRQVRQVTRDCMRRLAPAAGQLPLPDIGGEGSGGPMFPPEAGASAGAGAGGSRGAAPRSKTAERLERIVEAIRERSAGRVVVLVGHSGGGVAACHAGRRLLAEGAVRDLRIVQIGSPKVRIHPALRDRTAYFYAVDGRGRVRDPITRLGTWGGIRRAAAGFPVWDSRRWAPGHIAPVPIDGGHKDYFLHSSAAPGQAANLERIAAAILDWLLGSLHPARSAPPVDREAWEDARMRAGRPHPAQ